MPSEPTPTCNFCRGSAKVCPDWCRGAWHPSVIGGAAPSAPTTDAHMIHGLERCIAAAHRLLDEHHDATVVDRQDAEDAERLLAVLRGGATAPTPDPTDAERMLAYVDGECELTRVCFNMTPSSVSLAARVNALSQLRDDLRHGRHRAAPSAKVPAPTPDEPTAKGARRAHVDAATTYPTSEAENEPIGARRTPQGGEDGR
jgi:hypothetical protein